jgi:DNA-binding PadR family transcriptional regulator
MARTRNEGLLLGEWACLGILAASPSHGYDVAARLSPTGDVGRVWTLSRPLTYRALDQLVQRGLAEVAGEERGTAGGNRTILRPTRSGRAKLRRWLHEPVQHLRDVRGELMVKLLLCDANGLDATALLRAQQAAFTPVAERLAIGLDAAEPADPVAAWRHESSQATLRFLDRMLDDVVR